MRRRCQTGSVGLRNGTWFGRYWKDVPGKDKREHPYVVLGTKQEMTKTEAKRKLLEIIFQEGVNTPEHLEEARKPSHRRNFNTIASHWVEKRLPQLKPSSQYGTPLLIDKHLRPFFSSMKPVEIKTGLINEWIAELEAKGLEPKTIHNLWKLFRSIMNWWSRQNDEPRRTWYPTLPQVLEDEQRWFTTDETKRIVDAAKGQYRVLFHLAAYSGLRFGDLAGLHVEDLDFGAGVVHVRRAVWRGVETTPKTKRGHRDVWIDSATVNMLKEHLGSRTSGRVFQTRNGTPLNTKTVLVDVLHPLLKKLEIPHGGMHSFRHGRVSQMQAAGVPADFIRHQVGHSSLRVTARYTHFTDAFKRDVVERLANCTQVA